ncbi:MAG: glycosyltransferase [Chloroflexota bacterium]
MSLFLLAITVLSVLLTIQAAHTAYIMIYTWDRPEAYRRSRAPETFRSPVKSFTVLLPARHEEDVIQETIQRVVDARYPLSMMEVLVICEHTDRGTIEKVEEKLDQLRRERIDNVRLLVFDDTPINKPHGLNIGLANSSNDVVTIFDAEDEIHPDIFNIVNTVMMEEDVRVVQCGVQLMNYDSSWYSALNVLEYFFWFKSRLHYHSQMGVTPLGGNTIFFAREVLEEIGGWDEHNLTEDADVGIRISTQGERIRIVYDDEYVTKEETPPTLTHFVKQRTRWSQGFLQTLRKGDWLRLPSWKQRFMAAYTLGFPTAQAALALYVPVSLWMMFTTKVHEAQAIILLLPAYLLVSHYFMAMIGLFEFADAHGLQATWKTPMVMAIAFLPYQWILAYAAFRAFVRELRGVNNWEKTQHVGAHRTSQQGRRAA